MNDSLSTSIAELSLDGTSAASEAIVRVVADAKGVSPLELPPLASVIDPAALDRLVASMADRGETPPGALEFTYCDCRVNVSPAGFVSVSEPDAES